MGQRGPQRKPSALRVIEGDRGHQRINRAEPKPDPSMPVPPHPLRPEAQELWDRLAPELNRHGLLTSWDGETFAAYCETVFAAWDALEDLRREGLTVLNAQGTVMQNPTFRTWRDAVAAQHRLGAAFGLNPAARVTLRSTLVADDDDAESIFAPAGR